METDKTIAEIMKPFLAEMKRQNEEFRIAASEINESMKALKESLKKKTRRDEG